MTEVFGSSDTHFGHGRIQEFEPGRPGTTVEEMNEILIDNWNATVAKHDIVLFLGDACMGKIAESLPLIERLNGWKILFTGNHDRCWYGNGYKDVQKWTPKYLDAGFDEVRQGTQQWDEFLVNHFPYEGDSGDEDRYPMFRPTDAGTPLLHGHVHSEWKMQRSSLGTEQINVGTDVWDYRPVALDTIREMIR